MRILKATTLAWAFASALASEAAPALSSAGVTVVFDGASRAVTVSYELQNESAVVTAAFYRNGERMPAADTRDLAGDVNRCVAVGAHAFRWTPQLADAASSFAANELSVKLTLWPSGNEPPYQTVDIGGSKAVRYYATADDMPGGVTDVRYKTEVLVLRRIEAAGKTWTMGSPSGETGRNGDEAQHSVNFSKDFWIGVYPITQRQLFLGIGTNWSVFASCADAALHPADSCSFYRLRGLSAGTAGTTAPTADSFLGQVRTRTGLALDFPTEAQWEYAARAGNGAAFWTNIAEIAWYQGNAEGTTHPVGLKAPNAFGLYDTQGNVRECTLDWYTYTPASGTDPYCGSGGDVVYRSGGYDQDESTCRVARRRWVGWSNTDAHNGFRVAILAHTPSSVAPIVCEGTLATAANAFTRQSLASAGSGTVAEPFDSRIMSRVESEGTNFDPAAARGYQVILR